MDGIDFGFIVIRWNSILILTGAATGFALTFFQFKRRQLDVEILSDLIFPLLVWTTLGARLWHLVFPPLSSVELGLTSKFYFSNILDSFAVWRGGFGIPGALIGGALTVYIFARIYKLDSADIFDSFAPGILLAQAIGRLGNYFNQELYGLPSQHPWRIFIEPEYRLNGYEAIEYYHPLFAYESLLTFAGVFLVIWLSRKFEGKWARGSFFLFYLMFYALIRFLLEFIRLDTATANGVNANQVFFALVFLGAGGFFVSRYSSYRAI